MGAIPRLQCASSVASSAVVITASALVLAGLVPSVHAEPLPPDAGVFRGTPDADEPPEEVFERLEKRMARYCKGLGPAELREFYRVSFQAHQLFAQRVALERRRKLYASYLEKLCGRFASKHAGIGPAFPYSEMELFVVDVSTELCDLEKAKPTASIEAALRDRGASRRLGIARQFCQRAAPLLETPEALRAAFARAIMDELCLDPSNVRNEAYPPLAKARQVEAEAICKRRAKTDLDDVANVETLWSPAPAPAPSAGEPEPATPKWPIALAALVVVLVAAAVAYKLRARR